MAIVCQTSAYAAELRDFADMKNQKYLARQSINYLKASSSDAH
jgi:hypothetical protein